jgi:hypothetical protein
VIAAILLGSVGLSLPQLKRLSGDARMAQCMGQQRRIGRAAISYAQAQRAFPPSRALDPLHERWTVPEAVSLRVRDQDGEAHGGSVQEDLGSWLPSVWVFYDPNGGAPPTRAQKAYEDPQTGLLLGNYALLWNYEALRGFEPLSQPGQADSKTPLLADTIRRVQLVGSDPDGVAYPQWQCSHPFLGSDPQRRSGTLHRRLETDDQPPDRTDWGGPMHLVATYGDGHTSNSASRSWRGRSLKQHPGLSVYLPGR